MAVQMDSQMVVPKDSVMADSVVRMAEKSVLQEVVASDLHLVDCLVADLAPQKVADLVSWWAAHWVDNLGVHLVGKMVY